MTASRNEHLPAQLFRDIPLFIEAVRQQSFTKAAEKLDLPLPTFSRRISGMEKLMGYQLFYRKGPKIDLTDYGQRFFEGCRGMVAQVEETLEDLSEDSEEPRGIVRVLIHSHIYQVYMRGTAESFVRKWPGIALDIRMTGMMSDLLAKPYAYDLAITGGDHPGSELKVRRLLSVTPELYASPSLIDAYGPPAVPEDLVRTPCINFSQLGSAWRLKRGDEVRSVEICRRHVTDSPVIARELARAGAGIALLAPGFAAQDVKAGLLRSVLTDWAVPEVVIYAVRPPVQPPRRVRLFMDHLAEHLSDQHAGEAQSLRGAKV